MTTGYSENPVNWNEIEAYVNQGELVKDLYAKGKCFFYDTCSFRYHANLGKKDAEKIYKYISNADGMVILTRCILMELASLSGIVNVEYEQYIKRITEAGIPVYVIDEEVLFHICEVCFSTNAQINGLLTWAVRMVKGPVSTITATLDKDQSLSGEVLNGKNQNSSEVYRHFFSAVRANKEAGDNLGEELLAICLHILAQLPGEADGKFCIFTDDKGAAGKISNMFQRTNQRYRGKRIIIYSTPKLVQQLFLNGYFSEKQEVIRMLKCGISGNLKVLGTQLYDLKSRELSLTVEDAARQLIQGTLHITF